MSADIWILLAVKMQRKVEVIELSHKQYTPGELSNFDYLNSLV